MNTFNLKNYNLCVVTDCLHYSKNGEIGSNNAILIKQFNELFKYFNDITICCPISNHNNLGGLEYYKNKKIRFFFLPNLGGPKLIDKIRLLLNIPKIIYTIYNASKDSNLIYQRFPNNINIPGFFYTIISNKRLFASYLGEWDGKGGSLTYLLQKYLLYYFYPGPVFIYGSSKGNNFFSTYSPSFSFDEWQKEKKIIIEKSKNINLRKFDNMIFLNVGRVEKNKNQIQSAQIIHKLKKSGYNPILYIIGESSSSQILDDFINDKDLHENIKIIGSLPFIELQNYYRKADFIIQTPLFEGYGKVPIEGMMHGCIPLITNVGISEQIIANSGSGMVLSRNNDDNVKKVISLIKNQKKIKKMLINGRDFSKKHLIEFWAKDILFTLKKYYTID